MNSIGLLPQFPDACQKIRVLPELGKHFNNSANTLCLPHDNSIIVGNIKIFASKKSRKFSSKQKKAGGFFCILYNNMAENG